MGVDTMRQWIASVYPGTKWAERALYSMPARQVVAVYRSMEKAGKFNKKPQKEKAYHQLTLWELGVRYDGKENI